MRRIATITAAFAATFCFLSNAAAQPAWVRYVSPAHQFSFSYLNTYIPHPTVTAQREDVKFQGEGGSTINVTFLTGQAASGSVQPSFEREVRARGIPTCTGTCSVADAYPFWMAPGLEGMRYFVTENLPPRTQAGSATVIRRGPFYGIDIHPSTSDLLIFSPSDIAAESILFTLLPSLQPALSPRIPGSSDAASPVSSLASSEVSSSTSSSALPPPPIEAPTALPPPPSTAPSEALLFGVFDPSLNIPQLVAIAGAVICTGLLIVLRIRRKRLEATDLAADRGTPRR